MDEAGRSTETPLMVAPFAQEVDPEIDLTDAVSDNEAMSSSRTRPGSSRSGAPRAGGNGNKPAPGAKDEAVTGAGSAEAAETAATRAEVTAAPAGEGAVPLPADGIRAPKPATGTAGTGTAGTGKAADDGATAPKPRDEARKDSAPAGSSAAADAGWAEPRTSTMAAGSGNNWFSGQSAKAGPDASAASSEDTGTPSFKPSSSSSSRTSSSSGWGSSASSSSSSSSSSYGAPSSGSGSSYGSPSRDTGTSYGAQPSSAGSLHAPASQAPRGGGPSYAPPSADSRPHAAPGSGTGFSSGAASAVSGAAAGLAGYASSVSAAWQNRGKKQAPPTVRRPAKRQAMLTLSRVEPWSVMKFSFVASVVAFIILFVAVAMLYMVLSALGAFDSVQHLISTLTSSKNAAGTNISHWFSASLILGYTAMLGALNIVLITAMSTVGSVIYNLIAKTVGGIEVTLRETE